MKIEDKVAQFHEKFDVPVGSPGVNLTPSRALLRVRLILEETAELIEAIQLEDYPNMAKEAADVVYVVVGFCVEAGIPLTAVFDEVHRSNMSKEGNQDPGGKITKGLDYQPAKVETVIAEIMVKQTDNTPPWEDLTLATKQWKEHHDDG